MERKSYAMQQHQIFRVWHKPFSYRCGTTTNDFSTHNQGAVRIQPEFVVMENANPKYFILGSDFLSLYGIDIFHSKEKYFSIGNENKKKKFALSASKPILPVYQEDEEPPAQLKKKDNYLIEEGIKEAGFGPKLTSNSTTRGGETNSQIL